jgi:hypothetical protein
MENMAHLIGRMLLRHRVALEQTARELALRDSQPLPSGGSDVFPMAAHSLGQGPIQLRENTLQLANRTRFSEDKSTYK